jgi:uncharacterized repeat protein (TIGR04138 family)
MSAAPSLEHIARTSGLFSAEALAFVAEGLRTAAQLRQAQGENRRHLSAAELVDGCLELALERWSLLAPLVLKEMGLASSEDLGRATFLLIAHGVLSKDERDREEDFHGLGTLHRLLDQRARNRGFPAPP